MSKPNFMPIMPNINGRSSVQKTPRLPSNIDPDLKRVMDEKKASIDLSKIEQKKTDEEQTSKKNSTGISTVAMLIMALIVVALIILIVWVVLEYNKNKNPKDSNNVQKAIQPNQRMSDYASQRHTSQEHSNPAQATQTVPPPKPAHRNTAAVAASPTPQEATTSKPLPKSEKELQTILSMVDEVIKEDKTAEESKSKSKSTPPTKTTENVQDDEVEDFYENIESEEQD